MVLQVPTVSYYQPIQNQFYVHNLNNSSTDSKVMCMEECGRDIEPTYGDMVG